MFYIFWALDIYVIQQFAPTFERFVFFWPMVIVACAIVGFAYFGRKYWASVYQKYIEPILRIANKKVHPLYWIGLYIYLIVYYIVILPLNIYSWYTYGMNIFYIGIVGMFFIKDKTLLWSFLMLQAFMMILNRGDHVSIMVQPLIIIGFTIITYKIITVLGAYKKTYKLWKIDIEPRLDFIWLLGIIAIIALAKVNAYIPHDSEDLDAFYNTLEYANSLLNDSYCVMSMTKFTTRLNTTCVSDILLPCAYVHGDCVYRHFKDNSIFNYNISYHNMKYVIAKEEGLEFLKNWGKKNNASMFATADTIMSWPSIVIKNITLFINPDTNLTYGKFGEHRVYYHPYPRKEGEAIAEVLSWEEKNVSGYTIRENTNRR